jgi:hypothetical protein
MFSRLAERHRLRRALSGLPLAFALVLALGMFTPGVMAAPRAKADPGNVTLDITQPSPNNGIAEGPVAANVAVSGMASPGDAIALGIATNNDGCTTSGFQQLNGVTTTAQGDGSFTKSFAWPQIANNVGDRYFVCAFDTTTNAMGASQSLFQVDSSGAPSITVTEVNNPSAPTPGDGTPTPTPPNPPDGTYYAGGFVEVKGQNFTPGGIQIQLLLTLQQLTPATAATPSLTVVKGVAQTKHDGNFDVIAQLPSTQTGQFFFSATSSDGTTSVLPTLVASQAVQLALAPTPTPAPTVTPTPKVTATVSGNTGTGGGGRGFSKARIAGAIALGLFSAIFFIIGVALLISTSAMGGAVTRSSQR